MLRVAIYEDHPDLRAALAGLLGSAAGIELVGSFGDCLRVVEQCRTLRPEVVLMDIDMPGRTGIEGVRLLKKSLPETEVVMLTVFDDDDRVFQAICAGASGYLLKKVPPARLVEAIHEVQQGGAPMSPGIARRVVQMLPSRAAASSKPAEKEALAQLSSREAEIATLLSKGFSYKMVAAELSISIETVRTHVKRIYEKLHVHSLSEATAKLFL